MPDLDLKMEMRETESLASQQNGFPLLRKLRVKNKSREIARDVRVRLAFDPAKDLFVEKTATDREIIRPEILKGLGWKLERRWIMDRYIEKN